MTRRASWMDLDHAASAEGLGQTALLGDEERGRLSHGTYCSTLHVRNLSTEFVSGDQREVIRNPKWPASCDSALLMMDACESDQYSLHGSPPWNQHGLVPANSLQSGRWYQDRRTCVRDSLQHYDCRLRHRLYVAAQPNMKESCDPAQQAVGDCVFSCG